MFPDLTKNDKIPSNAFSFYDETLKQSIRPKKIRDRCSLVATNTYCS